MADFDTALAITLAHEGGFFQNPITGEVVNMGITRLFLRGLGLPATIEDIKTLTPSAASTLYLAHFWNPLRLAELNDQTLAAKLFDLAVNMGPETAVRIFQNAINDEWGGDRVAIDGTIGSSTIRLANASKPVALLGALRVRAAAHYQGIAAANPNEATSLPGWLARLAS